MTAIRFAASSSSSRAARRTAGRWTVPTRPLLRRPRMNPGPSRSRRCERFARSWPRRWRRPPPEPRPLPPLLLERLVAPTRPLHPVDDADVHRLAAGQRGHGDDLHDLAAAAIGFDIGRGVGTL